MRKHGIRPRHLDSHHHVHALPGWINSVADLLKKAGIRYVRVPCDRTLGMSPRRWVIYAMGRMLTPSVRRHGFRYRSLWYPRYADIASYNNMVHRLNRISDSEVLVHPAAFNDMPVAAPYDPYQEERVAEFRVLRLLALGIRLPRPMVLWSPLLLSAMELCDLPGIL